MRTNVLNDLSNVVKKGTGLACSWSQVGRMSEGAPDEHPMSIRSASDGERWKPAGEKGSTRVWKHVAMIFAVLVMSMANVGMAWGTSGVITAASTTDLGKGNTPRYVVEQAGVGRLMKNSDGSSSWSVSDGKLTTGSNKFALQTYNAISSIVINGYGTGNNRTFSSMKVGTATNNYAAASATGSGTMSSTAESQTITITPASNIAANSYVEITLSGNINIYSVELVYAGGATSHSVSAVTSTGTNDYGTVSAAASSVAEGGTTTITAVPASGYRVTNWAVSGTGASISPTGASNSTTTTLTMGTANATVTVTFGAIPTHTITYTNTKSMDNSANPTSYYEGVGVASFTKLRHAVGYDFTGWSPSSISSSATTNQTIDAQWTARAAAAGTGTLTYALAFGSGTITTTSITRNNGALYDATDVSLDHTTFADNANKTGCSGKLTTTSAKSESNYVELTFKIADGYTFTPTEVRVQGIAVSNNKTIEVELTDNAATPNSKSVSGTLTAVSSPTTGGYTVTLDFDASGEITLEGTVTVKIFAYGNTDHWRMGTPFVITGTVAAAAPSCTDPDHVDISGDWDYFGGETISLTATAYDDSDAEIAAANITGYQWKHNGVDIDGATSKTFTKTNCTSADGGDYSCVVSTGATCSTESSPMGIKVYVLQCYTGGETTYNFTRTGSSQAGTTEVTLSSGTQYEFKIYAGSTASTDYHMGNNGTIDEDASNWDFEGGKNNVKLNSGLGGTFTFAIDYSANGGAPKVSVTYPRKTIYLNPGGSTYWDKDNAKFGIYYFRQDAGSGWSDLMTAYPCGSGIYVAEIPQWNGVKIDAVRLNPSATNNNKSDWWTSYKYNQTNDCPVTSNDYITITGWNEPDYTYTTYDAPEYTISFDGNGETSGSMTDVEDIECDASVTLAANAYEKTGYTFTGWKDGSSNDYADQATISNIRSNIALTAQWTANTYTITLNKGDHGAANQSASVAYDATAVTSITHVTATGYDRTGYFDGSTKVLNADGSFAGSSVTGYITDSKWSKTADASLTAKWSAQTYTISYKDQGDNTYSGSNGGSLPTSHTYGSATDFVDGVKSGYRFMGWYTDASCTSSAGSSIGATAITANTTYYAKWAQLYAITDADPDNGSLAITDGSSAITEAIAGETVYIAATPSSGYNFDAWSIYKTSDAETTVSPAAATASTSFTMPAYAVTVDASFVLKTYDVTATLNHTTKESGTTGTGAATHGTEYSATFAAADGYVLPSDVTVTIGGVAQTKGTGYTWSVSAGVGTFTVPAAKVTGNIAVTITSTEDECGITLTQFGTQYKSGSNPRYLYAYTSNSFDEKFIIEADDSNTKGVTNSSTDSLYLLVKNGKFAKIHASAVLKDSTFEDVTKIKFDYRISASGKSKTLTLDVFIGATKVGSVSQDVTDQTWYTKTINVSPAKDGRVIIKNTAGSSDQSVHLNNINICGTLPTPCTEITPTWSTDYSSTTLDAGGSNSSTPTVGKDGSSGTLSFSSSDTDIATVNSSTGVVTPKKSGSVTITATVAADDVNNYCEGSITKTFTIRAGVTYDGNGKTSGSVPTDANKYAAGATVTTKTNSGSLAKTGYVFNGWNTKSDGTGTHYEPGATFSMPAKTSGVKLYAEWVGYATSWEWWNSGQSNNSTTFTYLTSKNYSLSFASSGSTAVASWDMSGDVLYRGVKIKTKDHSMSFWVQADKKVSITFGYMSTKPTFTVGGVNKAGDLSTSTTDSATVTYTTSADTKFYIENETATGTAFTIKRVKIEDAGYAITNGSPSHGTIAITDGSSAITTAEEDATVHISATPAGGYSFSEWTVTKDASGDPVSISTSSTANPATFTMPAEDVTVNATFTPNDYTITYHLDGASWADAYSAPDEYTVGTGATLPISSNMTNTGYTFGGWYDNSGLTGSSVTAISTSDYGDKEYWAKWTEITYDVTYNANGGSGTTAAQNGRYVTLRNNGFTAPSGKIFAEWNTASDGSGASYNEGEEVELTDDLDLYAIWANDYTITWDASAKLSGVAATPNLGGGNYTITASVATWTGTLTSSMISAETDGVTITDVTVDNSASPKTITATFNVGASVAGTSISLELDVPAYGIYGAKSSTKEINIDRCTGSGGGSDGVLFSAEFKDSGLGTSNICDAANTPFTFTTDQLKAAPTGGSIKAYTTDNLTHLKYVDNGVYLKGTDAVIQIDLDNAIATNDLFEYVNVHSSNPNAYLRHTSPTTTTDQIVLTGYGSKNVKVMLPAAFNGKTTLYIVKNSTDFKLHKAAIIRPAFLMLLDDSKSAADLSGTDVEMTTSTYLTFIKGGRVYYTSPSSGDLKIKESSSKKYIQFNKSAGYVKIVLNDALQEGDVIGFDSYNTNNLAFTTTATRSTDITSTNQLYTVTASSALKGQTTFYIWQNGGSSDYLRGLQIARSGVAGGGGGSDQIAPTLTWRPAVSGDADWDSCNNRLNKETGDVDFTFVAVQDTNSLGAITYSSSSPSVATVNAAGTVHIVGGGSATITATIAESGCYEEATATYNITVTDNCDDVAGTIETEDRGCDGIQMTVTGHTGEGAGATYQWYKDGVSLGSASGAQTATYTATKAGEYYVVVDNTSAGYGHCAMASANTITVEAQTAATATKLVDQWYVKNGRRTPDIALVQTDNADNFTVKSGSTVIWDTKTSVVTGFAGCSFYLGEDGIIYLKGQKDDETVPSGLSAGDETLKFTAKACGGDASELSITIHKQEATTYKTVAFVVDGTKDGAWNAVTSGHADGTMLYEYLDSVGTAASARKFKLYERNIYKTTNEDTLRQHYSQFDAILITDDPSTQTVPSKGDDYTKKGYVNAIGSLIDIRPVLTMEAYVSALANWKTKGINGNPSSPNPRQYAMKLDCKNHAIFTGINSSSSNVEVETIDGVEYWTVAMVDNTKSPYDKHADNDSTSQYPALQGFEASDVSDLMLLGEISEGTLYAGVERQEEPAARLLLLGLNNKALPNALTPEGKKIIENALSYLIETDMEHVDDCSNYFTGAIDTDWNKEGNWSKGLVPNSPYVKARILSPCVVSSGTFKVAEIDIATGGKSYYKSGEEINGSLTLNAGAALIIGGRVRSAKAPYFNKGDLMPTTVNDLIINTSSTSQAALVFNNDKGDTKATVNLYSKGRKEDGAYQFQYLAVPMNYIEVNPAFAGSGIYTYVWKEPLNNWERRGYYTGLEAFEGVGITTKFEEAKKYTLQGALTSTVEKDITLTKETSGQNIIGNSWLAPIDIASLRTALVEEDVDETIYIYCTGNDGLSVGSSDEETPGQWLAIPIEAASLGAWDGLTVIPAMQAFCIKANTGTALTLNYKDHVRSTATAQLNQPLRAPKRRSEAETDGIDLIRIRVADSKTHTDLYLFEGEQFSDEFDNGWEARYMSSDGRSAKLYAETTVGQMAVAAQPEYEGTVLGFAPGKEVEYTFTFTGPNKEYYLNDLKLKKSTLISEGESYLFTFEEGDTNRFYISKTRIDAPAVATGTENTGDGAKARKVIVNDKLYIILNGKVYSAEGMMVK